MEGGEKRLVGRGREDDVETVYGCRVAMNEEEAEVGQERSEDIGRVEVAGGTPANSEIGRAEADASDADSTVRGEVEERSKSSTKGKWGEGVARGFSVVVLSIKK